MEHTQQHFWGGHGEGNLQGKEVLDCILLGLMSGSQRAGRRQRGTSFCSPIRASPPAPMALSPAHSGLASIWASSNDCFQIPGPREWPLPPRGLQGYGMALGCAATVPGERLTALHGLNPGRESTCAEMNLLPLSREGPKWPVKTRC